MAGVEIFYFSGTGNSLAVARDMAETLSAQLTPVVSTMDRERVDTEADVVGLVFPIYDFKPPPVLEEFVPKLEGIGSKYLFAVCTYGLAPAQSLRHLDKVIRSCGGYLSMGFAVGMPHSGIGSGAIGEARRERMFRDWKDRRGEICESINSGEKGSIESSPLLVSLFQSGVVGMLPSLMRPLLAFMKQVLLKGTESLGFTSSERCDGCRMCERVCPVENIEIIDHRPVWSDHCAGCFACLNWCPQGAISLGGLDMNIRTYHHPEVKLSDMLRHRRQIVSAEG